MAKEKPSTKQKEQAPAAANQLVRVESGALALREAPLPVQHAWYEVARDRKWSTVALVPSEDDVNVLNIAKGFGQMAAQEPGARVLVVNGSIRDCKPRTKGSTPGLNDVWASVARGADSMPLPYDLVDFSKLDAEQAGRALDYASELLEYMAKQGRIYTTAIFALDPILTQARAIPLARSADKVCLCLSLGKTTLKKARRLTEIVGRERIMGVITVRPGE